MNTRMKFAFGCHLLATLIMAAFGITYLLRPQFMPYHSVAVGIPWADVGPAFRVLILALMRAAGSAGIAVVVMELILLLVPFRQGFVWARWAIPAGGLIVAVGALYAMIFVGLNTPASPPWYAAATVVLLFVAGLLISLGQPGPRGQTTRAAA